MSMSPREIGKFIDGLEHSLFPPRVTVNRVEHSVNNSSRKQRQWNPPAMPKTPVQDPRLSRSRRIQSRGIAHKPSGSHRPSDASCSKANRPLFATWISCPCACAFAGNAILGAVFIVHWPVPQDIGVICFYLFPAHITSGGHSRSAIFKKSKFKHVNNAGDISDISARFVAFVAFVAGVFYSRSNPSLCCPPACWNLF